MVTANAIPHRWRARGSSRGSTLFVVVTTLLLLTGAGTWAMHSSSSRVRSVGLHSRGLALDYALEHAYTSSLEFGELPPTSPKADCLTLPTPNKCDRYGRAALFANQYQDMLMHKALPQDPNTFEDFAVEVMAREPSSGPPGFDQSGNLGIQFQRITVAPIALLGARTKATSIRIGRGHMVTAVPR